MTITILGDFADPLSFLASQRVDQITSLDLASFRWLAVESEPRRPMTGAPIGDLSAQLLADLSLPGEHVPAADAVAPNSTAATAAYAESLSADMGVPHFPTVLRRALFDAVWVAHRRIDDADSIRQIVLSALGQPATGDINRRISDERLLVPLGDTTIITETRRLGYLVSNGRGPMSDEAHRRLHLWHGRWVAHDRPQLPLLFTPQGEPLSGVRALRWLAGYLPGGSRQAHAETAGRTMAGNSSAA